MDQIAEHSGVSKATVSRALGGSNLIGAKVRRQIEEVANELGYQKRSQRRHAQRLILTIRLVLPPTINKAAQLFYSLMDVVDGLKSGLHPSSANIIVETNSAKYRPFRHKKGGEADAFVFAFHRPSQDTVDEISERGVPCVVLNRLMKGVRGVISNHQHAMQLIAEHLAAKGVTGDCCFVGYQGIQDVLQERLEGFMKGCAIHGIEFDPSRHQWIVEDPQHLTREALAERYEAGIRTFVGVNDVSGAILVQQLRELGIKVPTEARVTGCDHGPIHEIIVPRLTTVDLSAQILAKKAGVSLYRELLEKETAVKALQVKGQLLVGDTT